jgi:hypothetical protein
MNRFVQLSLIALALNWPAWGQVQQSRTGGPGKPGPLSRIPNVFRLSTHWSNVSRTLVTGTTGNPNRLYKHHIILNIYLL